MVVSACYRTKSIGNRRFRSLLADFERSHPREGERRRGRRRRGAISTEGGRKKKGEKKKRSGLDRGREKEEEGEEEENLDFIPRCAIRRPISPRHVIRCPRTFLLPIGEKKHLPAWGERTRRRTLSLRFGCIVYLNLNLSGPITFLLPVEENDPTLEGRLQKSDARQMQTFYQQYYKRYIQELQNSADKADR
ncbi:hypothetical protein BHM03_00049528 [Ensete ventricosum]|nr:hypothetical protein BHM03_00049528 [Ensete ventricosum]